MKSRRAAFAGIVWAVVCAAASASTSVHGTAHLKHLFRHVQPAADAEAPAFLGAPPRQVGHQRDFFAFDFKNQNEYTTRATLRAVGDFCYIYVEDSQWNRRVTQRSVDSLLRAFNDRTAADSGRGIYEIETQTFGEPPDIDGDPRIYLLLLDVKDNYTPHSGSYVAGYFSPINQARGQVRDGRLGIVFHSNEIELLYIDTNPLNAGGTEAIGIAAHEFQHLLHYRYDSNEETWLDEGASELAMALCGYAPLDHVRAFQNDPSVSLVSWNSGLGNSPAQYGAVYLFFQYLYDQRGGSSIIRKVVHHTQNGMPSVQSALRSAGHFETAAQLFADWQTALSADDAQYRDGRYGFKTLNVRPRTTRHWTLPTGTERARLENWSVHFIQFDAPGSESAPLQFALNAPQRWAGDFTVQAALMNGSRLTGVRSLQMSSAGSRAVGSFGEFGETVDRVVVTVGLTASTANGGGSADYNYSAKLGEGVSFTAAAFVNPVHPGFIEIAAAPSSPVDSEGLVVELTSQDEETRSADMRSADAGKSFGASIRVDSANLNGWQYRLLYFGSVVGEGSI